MTGRDQHYPKAQMQRADIPFAPTLRRVGRLFATTATATALLGFVACGHHRVAPEGPPHPIDVEVKNNITVPTELTVWVQQDGGGQRQMVGSVPGAQTRTFSFTPNNWGNSYYIVGQRPLGGPVRSPRFTIDSPTTGTVSWSVIPNIVTFYDVAADTTHHPAPAQKDTTQH